MSSHEQKVALVTGATRGIGQAIAHALGKQGFYVVGTSTSKAGADSITSFLKQEGVAGEGVVLDVCQGDDIESLLSRLADESKIPLVLVNNAGVTADNLLLRMEDDEWNKTLDTNLTAVFKLTRACLKNMFRARFGRIINIGSVVGSSGNPGQSNYCATKAALIGFSKALAQEMGSRGITVNVVAPGFIDTDMTRSLPDMVKDEMLKRIPLKKLGTPEDVAAAVSFLVSDGAKYITGATIPVNGGMYMN